MHELRNSWLSVHVLDPEADAARLGLRFCGGGYVWQVTDHQVGPLLSGPEGPAVHPDPFNGHGLPEAFRHRTRAGADLLWQEGRGLAPGVGLLERDHADHLHLVERCRWAVTRSEDAVVFETEHGDEHRRYQLTRRLQLVDRDLLSVTRLSNVGPEPLKLQWFAHPFFSLGPDRRFQARVPKNSFVRPNAGFEITGSRVLRLRRPFDGAKDGHFELLQLPPGIPMEIELSHPRLAGIQFTTSFAPIECPVWANGHTVSIEPYHRIELEPAQTAAWCLRYGFGAAA